MPLSIQSSNVIKRSTPYLLFCRVLLCCDKAVQLLWKFLLFFLLLGRPAQVPAAGTPFVFLLSLGLSAAPQRDRDSLFFSNFCGVRGSVLCRPSVHIRVRASQVARVHRAVTWRLRIVETVGVLAGDLPAMLRRRVASQHWVEPIS